MEIQNEVKVYKVEMQCDKCKIGLMIPTGNVYTTYPAQYEHKCDGCGNVNSYLNSYPKIKYE